MFETKGENMRISHLRAARTAAVSVFISAGLTVPALAQAPAAEVKGDPARGAMKNSMCIGCHGIPEYKTAFPVLYRVPKIAYQNEAYLVSALKAYKAGERNHPSMVAVSTSLTEQDMADLAAFYARGGK
jgi:cytochrome c553